MYDLFVDTRHSRDKQKYSNDLKIFYNLELKHDLPNNRIDILRYMKTFVVYLPCKLYTIWVVEVPNVRSNIFNYYTENIERMFNSEIWSEVNKNKMFNPSTTNVPII